MGKFWRNGKVTRDFVCLRSSNFSEWRGTAVLSNLHLLHKKTCSLCRSWHMEWFFSCLKSAFIYTKKISLSFCVLEVREQHTTFCYSSYYSKASAETLSLDSQATKLRHFCTRPAACHVIIMMFSRRRLDNNSKNLIL